MKAVKGDLDIATVVLPERLDSETSKAVERLMVNALRPGAGVIVDGAAVVYMSAAGVRSLATVLHRAQEQQARIVFSRFAGPALDCLQVSGFTELLDIAESIEQAAEKLRAGAVAPPAQRLHA